MDAQTWTGDFLSIAEALGAILAQETERLAHMKVREIAPLQDQKHALAGALETQMKRLTSEPQLRTGLTAETRAALTERCRSLTATMQNNERALRSAREANERLFKAVVAATREERGTPGYTGRGTPRLGLPEARRDVISVALDRKF